jgi:hypothetical protein
MPLEHRNSAFGGWRFQNGNHWCGTPGCLALFGGAFRPVLQSSTGVVPPGHSVPLGGASGLTTAWCKPPASPLKPTCGTGPDLLLSMGWKPCLASYRALTNVVVKCSDHDPGSNSSSGVCASIDAASTLNMLGYCTGWQTLSSSLQL